LENPGYAVFISALIGGLDVLAAEFISDYAEVVLNVAELGQTSVKQCDDMSRSS
jgi:hypothetical protein